MLIADTYRNNAAHERHLASTTTLPRVQEQHRRSAHRWEFLARESEAVEAGMIALFGDVQPADPRSQNNPERPRAFTVNDALTAL